MNANVPSGRAAYPRRAAEVERLAMALPRRHSPAMDEIAQAPPPPSRHPAIRIALLLLGWLLIAATPFVAVLPGPGGIFVFAAGLALLLRNSAWAKRVYVRFKRRWPRLGRLGDRGLRRPSAARRAARDAAAPD